MAWRLNNNQTGASTFHGWFFFLSLFLFLFFVRSEKFYTENHKIFLSFWYFAIICKIRLLKAFFRFLDEIPIHFALKIWNRQLEIVSKSFTLHSKTTQKKICWDWMKSFVFTKEVKSRLLHRNWWLCVVTDENEVMYSKYMWGRLLHHTGEMGPRTKANGGHVRVNHEKKFFEIEP